LRATDYHVLDMSSTRSDLCGPVLFHTAFVNSTVDACYLTFFIATAYDYINNKSNNDNNND
jgi:hypothetical protein